MLNLLKKSFFKKSKSSHYFWNRSLSILKSTPAQSFLIRSSFSSSHVSDFCTGCSCWIVFSVLPMYLGSCTGTVGCPCGQPWVFGWPVIFLSFLEFLLRRMRVVCLMFECLQTIMPSFGLF